MQNRCYKIYKFTNKINGKAYIGVTNREFEVRKCEHVSFSIKNPKFKFHRAIKKYGINNFKEEILISGIITKLEANNLEIKFIKEYDTYKNGYNMTQGGGNRGDFKHSDVSKEKMKKAHLGKKLSYEHKQKIGLTSKGRKLSLSHKLNLVKSRIGMKHSVQTKIKISKILKNKLSYDKNPSAIRVNIYNSTDELKFTCNGNFEYVCKENNLPTKALRKSYYNNGKPIYTGRTIKKEVLIRNKDFIKWYAIKLP